MYFVLFSLFFSNFWISAHCLFFFLKKCRFLDFSFHFLRRTPLRVTPLCHPETPPPNCPKFRSFFSLKRAHLRVPALQKHHQNSTRPPEREKKSENGRVGEGKKSAERWVPPPSGPHAAGFHPSGPTLLAPPLGPPLLGPHSFGPHSSGSHSSGPSEPPLFLGLGPYVPHFIILLICSFFVHF